MKKQPVIMWKLPYSNCKNSNNFWGLNSNNVLIKYGLTPDYSSVIKYGLALVLEEIPGRNIEGLEKEKRLPREFFEELRRLVERIHERGLAHCDLKRAPNILLGHDGKPYIVDWSASIFKTESRFFPLNLLYRRFLLDDFNAITKIQLRHCPENVTAEEKKHYDHRSRAERLIRLIRNKARALLQKIA